MFPWLACHLFRIAENFSHESTDAVAAGRQFAGILQRSITWAGIISNDLHVLGLDVPICKSGFQSNASSWQRHPYEPFLSTVRIGISS